MAKRKRLSPARMDPAAPAPGPAARAPIAQIAGDVAALAALDEVREELAAASREGRLIRDLPLDQINERHLIRDRQVTQDEDAEALYDSIARRGQQTPIEVVLLEGQDGYGLISGFRRLMTLRALYRATGEARFATVQALIRRPEVQRDAYIAMVEENEVRADLTFYERARIVVMTRKTGVFEDDRAALRQLFAGVSFSKRSKIKSYIPLVEALDEVLPGKGADIPEKLGLALSKALAEDEAMVSRLRAQLREAEALGEELRPVLEAAVLAQPKPRAGKPVKPPLDVQMQVQGRRITLTGAGVDAALADRLRSWLKTQG